MKGVWYFIVWSTLLTYKTNSTHANAHPFLNEEVVMDQCVTIEIVIVKNIIPAIHSCMPDYHYISYNSHIVNFHYF